MALDTTVLRTTPQYWTAAVYKKVPGRGLIFQGYSPTVKLTWSRWVDRLMGMGDVFTRSYYWDPGTSGAGGKWTLDPGGDQLRAFRASGDFNVGALERKSPLPVGRYWQDIFEKQAHDWDVWAQENGKSGAIKIVKFETFKADPLHDGSWLPTSIQPDNAGTIPARTWVLFDVVRPVDWPAVKLGFPTIATADVKSSADTAQNPPGPTPGEEIKEALFDAVKPVAYIAGAFLGLKLLLSLRK